LKINCDNHDYTIYTKDDGLAYNSIKDIFKDNNGNYWFASYSTPGLTRFDGTNWTIIDYPWEKSGWVRNIFQDNNETIWFAAMSDGVHNLHDTIWTTYDINTFASSITSYNGEIIVGTFRGAQKYDNENWIDFLPELDSADILCMMVDHNNHLWFGNYNDYLGYGLAKYNGTTLEKISIKNNININRAYTIFEDSNSIIWVGGRGIASIQN
jgi:ligand-binding sensor domain-containing protein